MHKTKTELLELSADIKPKKEFEKEINRQYTLYDELLDKDTIAYLLVDQLGRNIQSISKIPYVIFEIGCEGISPQSN